MVGDDDGRRFDVEQDFAEVNTQASIAGKDFASRFHHLGESNI